MYNVLTVFGFDRIPIYVVLPQTPSPLADLRAQ